LIQSSVKYWVKWRYLDAKVTIIFHIIIITSSNSDVSIFSPLASPWVLKDVILSSKLLLSTIAYSKKLSVNIRCAAASAIHNTCFILLEGSTCSINIDNNWSLCNCSQKLIGTIWWNLNEIIDFNISFWWTDTAIRFAHVVRIIRFEL